MLTGCRSVPPAAIVSEVATPISDSAKSVAKAIAAPLTAGAIESMVSNRAEVQRFYGIDKFAKIESKLGWSAISRNLGPAFVANSSRNFVMSTTSFVLTPILFKNYFPQEKKSQSNLFWFGLGFNIFGGNVIAITQQALWGRALDYGMVDGGRNINCEKTTAFHAHAIPPVEQTAGAGEAAAARAAARAWHLPK
jgi:hypothetical protein